MQYQKPSGITVYPTPYYNSDGTTIQKHILDAQGNTIATVTGTGATAAIYYNHADHLTGSNAITNSAGALEELLDYYPYGDIRLDQKADSYSEQNKFTGYILDTATGLNYAGARYYNASIGRFTSEDPSYLAIGDDDQFRQLAKQELQQLLSDPQQLNSYAYAKNNPLVNIDPDGNISIRTGLELVGQGLNLGGQYVAYQAKQEWQDYQDFRQASYQWQTEHPKTAELLVNLAVVVGGTVSTKGTSPNEISKFGQEINSKITEPYKRPAGATNQTLRDSVQGKPCVDCGKLAPRMNADHKDPLVKEYYRTGSIDQQRMLDPKSVQPQCPSCSAKQGGMLSNFSKQVKNYLGIK